MHNPFLSFVQDSLVQRGVMCVKFNFPYKERGRRAPDRTAVLEATWWAMLKTVRQDPRLAPEYLFLSGKSMGGRMASHLAAQGDDCAGLIFLGYPLHPYNKKSLRADHLPQIRCPMLFIEGTRDGLCDLELLEPILASLDTPINLHRIEGGDHSFKVLKRLERKQESVWEEIVQVMVKWLRDVVFHTQ
jgi:predicted alpha/beta-hydrolase family hydrolase